MNTEYKCEESPRRLLESKKLDWDLSEDEIKQALNLIEIDEVMFEELEDLMLFLYSKLFYIYNDRSSKYRKYKYSRLLEKGSEQRRRINAIIYGRDYIRKWIKGAWETQSAFDDMVQEHPEWDTSNGFVVLRDHKNKSTYIEEFQEDDELSFVLAPLVMLSYHEAMFNYLPNPVVVDVASFMRKHLCAWDLHQYIEKWEGGDSRSLLTNMMGDDLYIYSTSAHIDMDPLLRNHGPALVQMYRVPKELFNYERGLQRYCGNPKGENTLGNYSMVLIGSRMEGSERRYLLQNWSPSKEFIEVDANYLLSCCSLIHFIGTTQSPQI